MRNGRRPVAGISGSVDGRGRLTSEARTWHKRRNNYHVSQQGGLVTRQLINRLTAWRHRDSDNRGTAARWPIPFEVRDADKSP